MTSLLVTVKVNGIERTATSGKGGKQLNSITVHWQGKAYVLDGRAASAVIEIVRQRDVVSTLDRVPTGDVQIKFHHAKAPKLFLNLSPDTAIDN